VAAVLSVNYLSHGFNHGVGALIRHTMTAPHDELACICGKRQHPGLILVNPVLEIRFALTVVFLGRGKREISGRRQDNQRRAPQIVDGFDLFDRFQACQAFSPIGIE